jgi:hypothetical protein
MAAVKPAGSPSTCGNSHSTSPAKTSEQPNKAVLIVHRVEAEDAEAIAAQFGTRRATDVTHQIDYATGFSEKGSIRRVDRYHVHPNEFRSFTVGQAAVKSVPKQRYTIVRVYIAESRPTRLAQDLASLGSVRTARRLPPRASGTSRASMSTTTSVHTPESGGRNTEGCLTMSRQAGSKPSLHGTLTASTARRVNSRSSLTSVTHTECTSKRCVLVSLI